MTEITVMSPEPSDPMQALALAQTNALQHLSETKADKAEVAELRTANRQLEEHCAYLQAEMHYLHHQRDYWSVQALLDAVGETASSQEKKKLGNILTDLSKEMGIPKDWRKDDRFKKGLGVYHPFVCKEFCRRMSVPAPPAIKIAKDPR